MKIVYSKNGVPIRVGEERLKHIFENHPEMKGHEDKIIETIENPVVILEGDYGELLAVKFYLKTPVSDNKYLISIYKENNIINDGFLITAYFTRSYSKRRKILWKHLK